jgi:hypothetical protein
MKILKIATLLLMTTAAINSVAADPLPFGCYVTDAERSLYQQPPTCYQSNDGNYSWLTPGNTSIQGLIDAYGDPVATFIKVGYDSGILGFQCDAAYKAQVSLVKRLRRACGSKCRRIK